MTNFPLLTAGNNNPKMSDKRRERIGQAAQIAFDALAAGSIANPVYQDIKDTLNRALDEAYRSAIHSSPRIDWPTAPQTLRDIDGYFPYLHTVEGALKKFEKAPVDHPMAAAALAVLREALPLAQAMQTLKTMAVKRAPKPVEDRRGKYLAPAASKVATGKVLAMLEQVTQECHDRLLAMIADRYAGYLGSFVAAQTKESLAGKKLSLYDHYCSRKSKFRNGDAYHVVSQLVEGQEDTVRQDAGERIQKLAVRTADDIRDAFLAKNVMKLDSIVEAKGNFGRGEVIGREVDLSGLRGTFRFYFADGSNFCVQNAVIWVTNAHGTTFYRTPLTFHAVVMADGKSMGERPSEKNMNTVFLGKK